MNALVRRTSAGGERLLRLLAALAILGTMLAIRPALAQTVATVTVTANPTSLVANGTATATVTATVRDAEGAPLSGQSVSFQITPNTLGSLSSPSGTTNASGEATVTFTAGTTDGSVTVQATAGSVTGSTRIRIEPNVPIPDGIVLTADPTSILGDDIVTATIRAVITAGGTPVEGTVVTFSTFHPGTFTPGGSGSGSATTNASGIAEVTFRSSVGGTAFIRGVAAIGQADATVQVNIIPVLTAIELTANPAVVAANGTSTSTIQALVRQTGALPAAGVEVTFSSTFGTLSGTTATTNQDGIASVTLSSAAEGSAALSATAGSFSDTATVLFTNNSVTITAPAANAVLNSRRPSVDGTATPGVGDSVRVFANGLEVCSVGPQPNGSWACTPTSDLPEGAVLIQAELTQTAVAISPRAERNITIDVTAPVAPVIVSPAAGATTGPRPTITGTAVGEEGGTVAVTSGAAALCQGTVEADGSWSCPVGADLASGAATIEAAVTDRAGNVGPPASRSFTVDASAVSTPTIGQPLLVNSRRPTIGGTSDTGTTVRLTISLAGGATVVYENVAVTAGAWSVNLATATPSSGALPAGGLADGTYPLAARARNSVGTTSSDANATLTVDATPPAVPVIVSPAAGSSTGVRPTISGTAEAGTTVTVALQGAGTLCTTIADGNSTWSCVPGTDLALGQRTIVATATDQAGNSAASAPHSFTVVTGGVTAPTFTSPLAVNSRTPPIAGAADIGTTVRLTIALPGGTTVVFESLFVNSSGLWSVNLATDTPSSGTLPTGGLLDGAYPITAQSRRGGDASTITSATLAVDTVAPGPPTVTRPANNASSGPFPVLSGTSENGSTVIVVVDKDGSATTTGDRVTYEVPASAQLLAGANATLAGTWTLNTLGTTPVSGSLGPNGLLPGTQPSFTVQARDAAGNLSTVTTLRLTIQIRVSLPLIRK